MEIYPLGYLIMVLAVACFFFKPAWLYEFMVFSVPFTGMAVFRIDYAGFAIEATRVTMFLGGLCLLRHFITQLAHPTVPRSSAVSISLLFVLALVGGISLIMPVVIDGDISVLDSHSRIITYADSIPLHFKFQYVTQLLYLIFGCLLAYYFAVKNDTEERFQRTIRIYMLATFFVCCWGLLELLFFYLKIPYPSYIFNQASINVDGTLVVDGRPRITSVALEPSIMAQQVLTVLPMAYWMRNDKPAGLKGLHLNVFMVIILVVMILCFSVTAVFGVLFFAFLVMVHFLKRKVKPYILYSLLAVLLGFVVAIPFLIQGLIDKLDSFSGLERLKSVRYGWSYFIQYPVLGIGWGVFPTLDLLVSVLTGIGVIGMIVFLSLLLEIFLKFRNAKRQMNVDPLVRSIGYSLALLLAVSQFSGFIFYAQYFWLILGLAIAAPNIKTKAGI